MATALVEFALAVATVALVAARGEHEPALVTALAALIVGFIAGRRKQNVAGGVLATLAVVVGGGYLVLVVLFLIALGS